MMSNEIHRFTSTGRKMLRHGALIDLWNNGVPRVQSLQVAVTDHCTLQCLFCSVAHREKKYVFDWERLTSATDAFIELGAETVEITGGGDPLCYPEIAAYIEYLLDSEIKVGLITNGIGLNKQIPASLLGCLSWLRVSANVLDYRETIETPKSYFPGTLGFSYCWTEGISTMEGLKEIKAIALDRGASYVRLVPNCIGTTEEQEKRNRFLSILAGDVGPPVFHQHKDFRKPSVCYWGYIKPFLYCDEYVYPCSSTVLNPDADRKFDESYRWCHWTEARGVWNSPIKSSIDPARCAHCVFSEHNDMLEYALTPQEHEEFV
jgi:hypothetical protein